jgi:hypothetical protein
MGFFLAWNHRQEFYVGPGEGLPLKNRFSAEL